MGKYDLPQVETHLYINGKWLEGSEGTVDVVNPATGETLASVQQGRKRQKKPLKLPTRHSKVGQERHQANEQN
ncbi:hypothetical protein [Enterococcus mundtii]|uniref:hypothetical protein n=1 Tax=Enterococcus mundtii TaxID=53346 RepID=UPI001F412F00|nr:hypothetical protein [Enterococcus mundtii]